MENLNIKEIKEENIFISDIKRFEQVKNEITEDGLGSVHILADFDKTLTKQFVDGKEIPSLISVLRDHNYLTPDYPEKAHALFDKYHAIETDNNIPRSEKAAAMHEWWSKHYQLLIESRLNKKDMVSVAESGRVKFRDGVLRFFDFLKEENIPLVIISSAGLGKEAIEMYIKNAGKLYDNIHIVSNEFEWDEDGYMIKVKEPIIHTMNKNETTLQGFPFFKEIKDRKNIILIGDSLDDMGMTEGFEYKNLLSVGFLNKKVGENLGNYKEIFDAVVVNDSSFDFVNSLLERISRKNNKAGNSEN